jgi:hypothetical protein
MGLLDAAVTKITSIIGITTKGQATKANSLPVVLPSDQGVGTMITDANGRLPIAGRGAIAVPGNISTGPVGFAEEGATTIRPVATVTAIASGAASVMEWTRSDNTLKTAQSSATASGSDLTIWTPASGKKFRLRSVAARASIAGRYEVRDASGTVICYTYLAANTWTEIVRMQANGYLSAAANNALLLRNQSGSAADLDAVATGCEE